MYRIQHQTNTVQQYLVNGLCVDVYSPRLAHWPRVLLNLLCVSTVAAVGVELGHVFAEVLDVTFWPRPGWPAK